MVASPVAGHVVLVPFPFSDLSKAKLRPAVVLAEAGRGDWILCQVTSSAYGDPRAVALTDASFATGSLPLESYVRPGKLFTGSRELMVAEAGRLTPDSLRTVVDSVIAIRRGNGAGTGT